jgi:hypothetical protein
MANIYVSEFAGLANTDMGDSVPILSLPALASYTVAVSGAISGATPTINPKTKFIEISTDTTCSFKVAPTTAPAAALTDCRLVANERIIRRVQFQGQDGPNAGSVLVTSYSVFTTSNV